MALSFAQWVGSVIAEQVRSVPDPAVVALTEQVMTLAEAVAKLNPASDAAVAKIAELSAANATLQATVDADAAQIADLTAQRDAALAAAANPADVQAVSDDADKLNAAVAPPAPPDAPANP